MVEISITYKKKYGKYNTDYDLNSDEFGIFLSLLYDFKHNQLYTPEKKELFKQLYLKHKNKLPKDKLIDLSFFSSY